MFLDQGCLKFVRLESNGKHVMERGAGKNNTPLHTDRLNQIDNGNIL